MNIDKKVLDLLVKNAEKAFKCGEIPVSAVIVDRDGKVVSHSFNNRQNKCNVLGHAEINCILKAEKKIRDWRLDGYSMVVSLEPCDMCSMVVKESRLDNVYYFLPKRSDKSDYIGDVDMFMIEDYPEYTEKFKFLLTSFFDNKR
jgi:tRNA(Arg) A34 adenosine deaminase TadA